MTRQLNPTEGSLLGFLHEGPMSGWDLVARAQDRIGEFWSLTQSQVYRELARMAEDGLVEAGERGARSKRPYTITETGREAFAQWVERVPGTETIRFPLLLTMAFGAHLPGPTLESFLARHRLNHADRLARYVKQREEMPDGYEQVDPFAVATLEFGITYERAVLQWFDGLPSFAEPEKD